MFMKKILNAITFMILAAFFTGCSFFAKKEQLLTVNTNPADCQVIINGQTYTAPVQMMIPTTSNFTITALKSGYSSKTETLGYTLSKTGILDAVGLWLFLLPGLGLLSDGAFTVSNSHVFIDLTIPQTQVQFQQ